MTTKSADGPSSHGRYAEVNGLKMYFEIYGEGSPLVLIHGGGSTIQSSFGRIIPDLMKKHRLIAVELQNHGRSGTRQVPQTFTQDADDVAALLEYNGIARADFLGFSNGGNTALEVALRHPEIVQKLILASAPLKKNRFISGFFEGLRHATLADMPQELQDAFLEVNPDAAGLKHMFEKDRDRMLVFEGWSDQQISSVQSPTLILAADRDVFSPEHAVETHRLISGSRLAIVPGTHGSYIGEIATLSPDTKQTDFVVPLIESFLHDA